MKYGSLSRSSSVRQNLHTPTTFFEDFKSHGSVPHSMMVATVIGIVCGISAWFYYAVLQASLEFLWKTLPEMWMGDGGFLAFLPPWMWIPLVGFCMAIGLGLAVQFLGDPGDLPYTIKCVHSDKAFLETDHILPMVVASLCSIVGGGSLGPEAPLVAICAVMGGFVSRHIFKCTENNVIRKHTLMGMAAALAAFFGCPLGGSLFALEITGRFGIEYFEHTVEAILCGEVSMAVFRALARLPISPIWTLNGGLTLGDAAPMHIAYGIFIGLVGATIAACFTFMHRNVLGSFKRAGLLAGNNLATKRALAAAVVVMGIGIVIPATLFWGEREFQTVATLESASTLEHAWPTQGAFGFEMDSFMTCLAVGVAKLVAISFSVAGGYRGGFIFPLFTVGAAFGRAVYFVIPAIPVQICVLCMAASINVAITRTSIATTLILAYLAGEQNAVSAILAASLTSLCATAYMPFMATQVCRSDLEASLFRFDDTADTDSYSSGDADSDETSNATNESSPLMTRNTLQPITGSVTMDV